MSLLSKLGLQVPSKFDIAVVIVLFLSLFGNYLQWKTIQNKNAVIEAKDSEISTQHSTIDLLRNSITKTALKINEMNEALAKTEKDYQTELNKLINDLGQCRSNEPETELEAKAQQSFQEIINNLANSTVKKKAKQ